MSWPISSILWQRRFLQHNNVRANSLGKTLMLGKFIIMRAGGGKGVAEDEMVGWHHQLNGHESEQTLGDGERQGSLVCCSPWGRNQSELHAAAAAAKLLQSCPTLCDPIDGGPPGSPVPGTLQARTLEWVAISFSNAWKGKVKVKSLSRVWLLVTPWSAAYQALPSMGFSRQEYWSGVPLPSSSDYIKNNNFRVNIQILIFYVEMVVVG